MVVVGRANTLPSWEFAVRGAVVDRDGTSPLLKTVEIGHRKGGARGAVTSAEGGPNDDDGDDATCPFRVERGHGRGSGGCGSDFFGVRDGTFVGDGSRWSPYKHDRTTSSQEPTVLPTLPVPRP